MSELIFEPFIIRALTAGIGVAIIAGVMGCFVVWRRMAYFGDSLAHSALLGLALGLAFGLNLNMSTLLVCGGFAVLLLWLQHNQILTTDTLLGILAHAALSIGMVTISLIGQKFDFYTYLFGDILTVTYQELMWIYGGGVLVIIMFLKNWAALTLMTIHEGLARAEGVRVLALRLLLVALMTIVVSISIRIVGILLITSMLIIPAATARQLTRSPEMMALTAILLGVLAVIGGATGSLLFDLPSGPAIVVTSVCLFVLLLPLSYIIRR